MQQVIFYKFEWAFCVCPVSDIFSELLKIYKQHA